MAHRVLVKFKSPPAPADLSRISQEASASRLIPVGRSGWYLLDAPTRTVAVLVATLGADSTIAKAAPDAVGHIAGTRVEAAHRRRPFATFPDDPDFALQWALYNNGQTVEGDTGTAGDDIDATDAWDYGIGGTGVAIAVLDTGIFYNDADLASSVWSAPAPYSITIGDAVYQCPEGSHGFNSSESDPGCDGQEDDYFGHGSAVASIAGASGNNGIGMAGAEWAASLVSIGVYEDDFTTTDSDVAFGIDAVLQIIQRFGLQAPIRVLNLSAQFSAATPITADEMQAAAPYGLLFIAATGDYCQSTAAWPAAYDLSNEIAVAASDQNDAPASWGGGCSNGGGQIAAPGKNIVAYGADTGGFGGTSASAPFVAGGAALLESDCPLYTPAVIATLEGTATQVSALDGIAADGRRLDLGAAVESCKSGVQSTATISVGLRSGGGDTGDVWAYIDGKYYRYYYDTGSDDADTIAAALASAIDADYIQTSVIGSTIYLTTNAFGPYTVYSLGTGTDDDCSGSCGPAPVVHHTGFVQ